MRFDQRLLWAWGVATLVHVGAAVAQGPLPPAAPPADPVQFQPAAPLTPIGAAVPAAPSPTMLTSGTAPVNTTPTPQPPTAPAPQPPQFVATQPAPPPVATAPVATAPVAAAHVATVPVTSGTVPVLEVKQLLPDSVVPGQTVAAEVTVTNTGGRTADNVVLAGWWTAGYDLTEATVVATPGTNGRQTWGLGAIPAGETRTVKVKLTPKAGVAATEFRSGFDATFSSATDTRAVKVLKPELQVAVEGSDTAFVGQAHPLTLKVKNPSAAGLEKVFVKVELPDSLAHPKGTSLESEIAVLGGGSTESIPLNLTAVRAGVGRVKVRVSSPGCDTLTHDVMISAVEARVSVTVSGPKTLYQNWPATFEAVIENNGDHPIKGATFDVKLPPGLTDLRASDKPGFDATGNRLVWKFDSLAPGEKKTLLWFGFAKQSEDLTTSGAVSVSGIPLKRAEHTTKNLGTEGK